MPTLRYRCPLCGTIHDVDEALVGDTVDCRNCGRPFTASAPIATPLQPGETIEGPSFRVNAGEGDIERVLLSVHPVLVRDHPILFFLVVIGGILGLIGLVLGLLLPGQVPQDASPTFFWIGGLILLVASAIYLTIWWIYTQMTELTVTEERTTYREGIIARRTSEVRHRDVRNLQIDQTVFNRLMGVGDVSISSAAQDDLEITIKGVANPHRIATLIRDMQ